ncbi:hypothetical protein CLU79DRAFT_851885 [Phycomyces nitens]|nr:hypothetical protein CLU79DRAFT_851885 [Phycomyces nitens]
MAILTLLKRECPYCKDSIDFSSNQVILRHIHKTRMKILPPRPRQLQNVPSDMPLNARNRQLYPGAPLEISCPCCNESFANRMTLKYRVVKGHVVFVEHNDTSNILPHIDTNPFSSIVTGRQCANWMIGDTSVSECFRQLRAYCLENGSKVLDIDQHFHKLLPMSSIFVVQQRHDYKRVSGQFFSTSLLRDIHRKLTKELDIEKAVSSELMGKIKKILKDFRNDNMDDLDTRMSLLSLARQQNNTAEKNVVLAVESLIPSMKDVNLKRLSEQHIVASYVHPFVQFLVGNGAMIVPHCANCLVDNEDTDFDKRPDYVTDVYDEYEFSHSTVFGEIKVDSSPNLGKITDFYRLALFGKQALEKHQLNGVILFQSIGTSITFYYLTQWVLYIWHD